MNRKPIFTIVLSALLVLALFAGCEQAQLNLPKKVVSAEIIQTGDLLNGQDFDSTKFEVRVIYDDSSETRLNGGNVVALDSTDPTAVTATAGIGVDEKPYTVTAPIRFTSVDSITVTAAAESVKTDATAKDAKVELDKDDVKVSATYTSLFGGQSVTVDLPYKGVEATVEAKLDAALEAKTGATGTATVTAKLDGKEVTATINVVYSTATVTDYSKYTYSLGGDSNRQIAYRLVPATTSNSVRYINSGAFDADSMIELYYVLTDGADTPSYAYELIDSSEVEYTLDNPLDADHKTTFPSTGNAVVSFELRYQTEENAPYNKDTIVTKAAYILSDIVATEEDGIYEGTRTDNNHKGDGSTLDYKIEIPLTMDYITKLSATANHPFIIGDTPYPVDFTVTATYKSGVTKTLTGGQSADYDVDRSAIEKGDTAVKITLNAATVAGYEAYSDAVTEVNASIRIVDNYIKSITSATQKTGTKHAIGKAYSANEFDIVIEWADSAAEEKPAVTYTFSSVPSKMTDDEVTVTYTVSAAGQTGKFDIENIQLVDIPLSISFKETVTKTFTAEEVLDKTDFSYNVVWASDSSKTVTTTNPGINIYFTPEKAGAAGSTTTVRATWECYGWTGSVNGSASVTVPGV